MRLKVIEKVSEWEGKTEREREGIEDGTRRRMQAL